MGYKDILNHTVFEEDKTKEYFTSNKRTAKRLTSILEILYRQLQDKDSILSELDGYHLSEEAIYLGKRVEGVKTIYREEIAGMTYYYNCISSKSLYIEVVKVDNKNGLYTCYLSGLYNKKILEELSFIKKLLKQSN